MSGNWNCCDDLVGCRIYPCHRAVLNLCYPDRTWASRDSTWMFTGANDRCDFVSSGIDSSDVICQKGHPDRSFAYCYIRRASRHLNVCYTDALACAHEESGKYAEGEDSNDRGNSHGHTKPCGL